MACSTTGGIQSNRHAVLNHTAPKPQTYHAALRSSGVRPLDRRRGRAESNTLSSLWCAVERASTRTRRSIRADGRLITATHIYTVVRASKLSVAPVGDRNERARGPHHFSSARVVDWAPADPPPAAQIAYGRRLCVWSHWYHLRADFN